MAKSNKKRQNRTSDVHAAEKKRVKTHDWEKDDTEVDLEAKLFGTSRVKGKGGKGKGKGKGGKSEEVDTGLGQVDDDDVSVAAPQVSLGEIRNELMSSFSRLMRL